jgi:hypothetical protein
MPVSSLAPAPDVAELANLIAERFTAPPDDTLPPSEALALLRPSVPLPSPSPAAPLEEATAPPSDTTPAARQLQLARRVYSADGEPRPSLSIVG